MTRSSAFIYVSQIKLKLVLQLLFSVIRVYILHINDEN